MRRAITIVCVLLGLLAGGVRAHAAELEYQVKAAFLLNAMRFIQWPEAAFQGGANSPVVIGIIGEDPFGSSLKDVVREETVQRRRIVIRNIGVEEAANCHLVFISRSEGAEIGPILRSLEGAPVLTVSEVPRFAHEGGVLCLTIEDGKVRFQINTGAARKAKLKVDSRLLSLAKIVG